MTVGDGLLMALGATVCEKTSWRFVPAWSVAGLYMACTSIGVSTLELDDSTAAPIVPGGTTSFGGAAKSVVAKLQAQRPEPAVMSTASMSISRVSPKAVIAREVSLLRISLETERLGGFGFAGPPFSGTLEVSVDVPTSVGLLRVVSCFSSRATAARNRIILAPYQALETCRSVRWITVRLVVPTASRTVNSNSGVPSSVHAKILILTHPDTDPCADTDR
jgi:hypothetical protein